jgi:hypothetical protein
MSTPFLVLYQQKSQIHRHRINYYSLKLSDAISIEVLPATSEGILKAFMHAIPGYDVKLLAFKEEDRPCNEDMLISLCAKRISEGKYKEIKAQIRGNK